MGIADTRQFLDNLWRWKCGLEEHDLSRPMHLDIDSLFKSEWSYEFENLMRQQQKLDLIVNDEVLVKQRNRLVLGAMRYGLMHAPDKKRYDNVGNSLKRLEIYESTRNSELLYDIAHLMMVEFVQMKQKVIQMDLLPLVFKDRVNAARWLMKEYQACYNTSYLAEVALYMHAEIVNGKHTFEPIDEHNFHVELA